MILKCVTMNTPTYVSRGDTVPSAPALDWSLDGESTPYGRKVHLQTSIPYISRL